MTQTQTIPESVLAKIVTDWPAFSLLAQNIREFPTIARQAEKALACAVLELEAKSLTPSELHDLVPCIFGKPYGQHS